MASDAAVAGVAPPSGIRAETHLKFGLAYAYGSNVANGVHATDPATLYHSVTDAILGALTLPDIGQFFPDTDPRWKGCDSEVFLAEAWKHMDARGYKVSNLDVTLILQKPRVAPIKEQMKDNLVRVLQTSASQVNVKARTHEKVDSIGEGRALSCHAVLVMEKK